MSEKFKHIEIPQTEVPEKDKPKNPGRRTFVKLAVASAGVVAASQLPKVITQLETNRKVNEIAEQLQNEEDEKKLQERLNEKIESAKEKKSQGIKPLKQLEKFGEIYSMKNGIQAIYDEHFKHLTETGSGRNDMETTARRLAGLDLRKYVKAYTDLGLPKELAYMILIQESRGRNVTNTVGARGPVQITKETAETYGVHHAKVGELETAGKVSAKMFKKRRDLWYGDDVDLCLHSYTGGKELYGYKEATKERIHERCADDFYEYMKEQINEEYKKIEKDGFYVHTLDEFDFPKEGKKGNPKEIIRRRFKVPWFKIQKENNLPYTYVPKEGDVLHIPYTDMKLMASVVFRKKMHGLRYAPQVKAKYDALKKLGLLPKLGLQENIALAMK